MKKIWNWLALAGMLTACSPVPTQTADYRVIPLPDELTTGKGDPFVLTSRVTIGYPEGNADMERNARFLAEALAETTGTTATLQAGAEGAHVVRLELGLDDANPEAYRLTVEKNGVRIAAPTPAGVFYGIQALRKALPVAQGETTALPAAEVYAAPRFGYRGAHLDVSRHFFSVEEVKTYLDMMALHQMNRFHWHLTDDQGWRVEIKQYPRLAEVASQRKETVIGRNSGRYDGVPHGGCYTQDEIREVVAYAAERYITVVPEVDLPGHMQAVLAAYPELGCTGGPYEVWTMWGVSDNVLCAGDDRVFAFLKNVFTELLDLFPSEYIHVGGDECPKSRWAACPKCQARIRQLGLRTDSRHTKEERLQSYVIGRVERFLNEHGRRIIGWDEILEGGLAPNASVMSWRGTQGGIAAARQHHEVIMTPCDYLYFNFYQSSDRENEPLAIGGYVPVQKVYEYDPVPAELTAEERPYIVGVQANLWTEYIADLGLAQYMALPRFAALSEIQWCRPERKDFADFKARLPRLVDRYDALGYRHAELKPEVLDEMPLTDGAW